MQDAIAAVPTVSVVVVGDVGSGTDRGWQEMRQTLAALARQDLAEPYEVLVGENESVLAGLPDDLRALAPLVRFVVSAASNSQELKNLVVAQADAPLIAIVDADVMLAPDWLSRTLAAMRAQPQAVVVSGRTLHASTGLVARALALLERGFVDPGHAGETRFLACHAMLIRRPWWLAHPADPEAGPFASRLQSESILRAGGRLYFEPAALAFHQYAGWRTQRDIFRNAGYGTVVALQRDRTLPFAWLIRLGVLSIPAMVLGKTWISWRQSLHLYRHYLLRRHELPVLLGLAAVVHLFEIRGMRHALRGDDLPATDYR